jgi:thiol-disulfide isomerase/thioredoxin
LKIERRHFLLGSGAALIARSPARAANTEMPRFDVAGHQLVELMHPFRLPAVSLIKTDGTKVILNGQGKAVLLNFWATWCPPCRRELPMLARLKEKLSSTLRVVPVAIDRSRNADLRAFLAEVGATSLDVYVEEASSIAGYPSADAHPFFPLWGLPISYLVSRAGKVRGYVAGAIDWASPQAANFVDRFATTTFQDE